MAYELRLEVNIDVIKSDIEPELIRAIVKAAIQEKLSKTKYVVLQSVNRIY